MTVREHEFRRCTSCATLFVPGGADTGGLYADPGYFAMRGNEGRVGGYQDYMADRPHVEAKFRELLERVERLVPPGRLLDVGCGPGFLLSVAEARGWEAVGVDLNPWAVAHAREELGLDAREVAVEDAGFEADRFDLVAMLDLIEHVPDPDALVGEAARVLRPEGVLAVLTPDAASPVSRALGARWPEVERVPEHVVLFSVAGLVALLARHGFAVHGWHSAGKTSTLRTLVADLAPAAPAAGRMAERVLAGRRLGERVLHLDPRTKFCLYARLDPAAASVSVAPRALRLPRRPPEEAIVEDLRKLAGSRRFVAWTFDQFRRDVGRVVLEVGAGIGTFTEMMLDEGAERVVALEPDGACAEALEERFDADRRVTVLREGLPGAPEVEAAAHDLVVCQNVLEHIEDDAGALAEMAGALRPGGRLFLLVPAHQRLFGALDRAYGHHRRYERDALAGLVRGAGLEVEELYSFNLLAVPGWILASLRGSGGIDGRLLRLYDAAVCLWRPLEERLRPRFGASLIVKARRP